MQVLTGSYMGLLSNDTSMAQNSKQQTSHSDQSFCCLPIKFFKMYFLLLAVRTTSAFLLTDFYLTLKFSAVIWKFRTVAMFIVVYTNIPYRFVGVSIIADPGGRAV